MFRKRLKILFGVFVLVWLVLVGRLFQVQVARGSHYRDKSARMRMGVVSIDVLRGNILDRHGKVLASDEERYDITVTLADLPEDPEALETAVATLAGVLEMKPPRIVAEIERCQAEVEVEAQNEPTRSLQLATLRILRNQPRTLVEGVRKEVVYGLEWGHERLPGLGWEISFQRHYTEPRLMCHIVGYMGNMNANDIQYLLRSDGSMTREEAAEVAHRASWSVRAEEVERRGYRLDDLVGRSGIEASYERQLKGRRGRQWVERDRYGAIQKKYDYDPPKQDGAHVTLTISTPLQRTAVRALADQTGALVVMDIDTGEILAMASAPDFDTNGLLSDPDYAAEVFRPGTVSRSLNRATQGMLPLGSVFKIIASAVALEEGMVRDSVTCQGYLHTPDRFRCWRQAGHGAVDLHDAIVQSCNVYFYVLGEDLCALREGEWECRLVRWSRFFGIGERTGIDLPGEGRGLLPSRMWRSERNKPWTRGYSRNIAVGQGDLKVTPLQAVRAIAAVASGGKLVQPHLVKGAGGETKTIPLSPATVATLKRAMRDVVETPRGTGYNSIRTDKIRIAGKTGTAQTSKPAPGPEGGTLNHAWFVGYAPSDSPKFAIAVVLEHVPGHGGEEAGPVVRPVAEAAAALYD